MKIKTFSLPAGQTCPGALECKSMAVKDKETGKLSIKDGNKTVFRCFAASQEAQYTNVYNSRQQNLKVLKSLRGSVKMMADYLEEGLLKKGELKFGKGNAKLDKAVTDKETIRIHVSGDFFKQSYFDAWVEVARRNPDKHFYAYTKSLNFWVSRLVELEEVNNFVLTASRGGRFDYLINDHDLREAIVVFSENEAFAQGLEIDHDDTHAMKPGPNFALLIHGTQPKGSEAASALRTLKGKGSYSK